jgi:hypothetical protein
LSPSAHDDQKNPEYEWDQLKFSLNTKKLIPIIIEKSVYVNTSMKIRNVRNMEKVVYTIIRYVANKDEAEIRDRITQHFDKKSTSGNG